MNWHQKSDGMIVPTPRHILFCQKKDYRYIVLIVIFRIYGEHESESIFIRISNYGHLESIS